MIYDVYEQNEQTHDIIGNRKVTRYHTTNKAIAFHFINEKNKLAGKNVWRVAIQVSNRIIFDIDDSNLDNVKQIYTVYKMLFNCEFKVIQTLHGYHLISNRYNDSLEWQYDTCRVLNPLLESCHLQNYIEAITTFYNQERDKQKIEGLQRDDFIPYFTQKFKESGLYCGIEDFDILFAVNVIMKGYYCLRISKKSIDDKPIEITI